MTRPDLSLMRELEAALAWWQDAGVTHDFSDDATAWLAEAPLARDPLPAAMPAGTARRPGPAQVGADARGPLPGNAPPPAARAPAPSPAPNLLGDSPPGDLATFREWWLSAPGLDTARGYPRIAGRGERGAALMVLVPQPEAEDREHLLEGPQGRLLANMLGAMGISQGEVLVAAALPCHTPMADCAALAAAGMQAVTLHHLALAAPQRLLVLGTALGPMLGMAPGNGNAMIELKDGTIPVMTSETLEAMLASPALKARFWRRWIEWTAAA